MSVLKYIKWEKNSKQSHKFNCWDKVLVFATHPHDIISSTLKMYSAAICNYMHLHTLLFTSNISILDWSRICVDTLCWTLSRGSAASFVLAEHLHKVQMYKTFIFSIQATFREDLEGHQICRWSVMNFYIFKLQALAVEPPSDLLVLDLLTKSGGFSCRGLQRHSKHTTHRSDVSTDNCNRTIDK